jgi:hypothetical protein
MDDDPFASQDGAPFDPFDPSLSPALPPRKLFPWATLGLAFGGIALIAAFAVGINWLLTRTGGGLFERPEQVVERYYDALQRTDFEAMGRCFDPQDVTHDNILPYAQQVLDGLDSFAKDSLGLHIKVRWQFSDLEFKVRELTGEAAKVDVAGKLRVWEESTNIGPTVRYEHTHEMVRRNSDWYIRP